MTISKKNINIISKDCTGCSVCSTICPKECIDYRYDTKIGCFHAHADNDKCIDCNKCIKVCPVNNNEIAKINPSFVGSYQKVFASYCKDINLRKACASGGFITSFLCYMLEKGHADAALVSKREGTTGHSFLATTKEEIIEAKTSIYAPVDYSVGIKELQETQCKKIIAVGLPCHIQAITNLRKLNKNIDSKVFMTISIVCGKTPTTNAYRYIANKNGIDYDSIISVKNRGEGWPGYMTIKHEKGEYRISYKSNMSMGMVLSSPFMCNPGCLSCVDGVGITADMSVCDAWNEKYTKQESDGWNFVLAKTKLALQYLTNSEITQYIHLEDETIEHFYSANKRVIEKSKVGNKLRQKGNKITPDTYKLNLKESVYVTIMKFIRKHGIIKDSANISHYLLVFGKILNKLKN